MTASATDAPVALRRWRPATWAPLAVLVALCAIITMINPNFLSFGNAVRISQTAMIPLDIVAAVLVLGGSTLALTAAIGVVRFPDTLTRMHAVTKPQVLGLLLVLAGAAIRLRVNVDVGMVILTGLFTLITAPVVANRVGQLAYREQNIRDDLLTRDDMHEFAENGEVGGNDQN